MAKTDPESTPTTWVPLVLVGIWLIATMFMWWFALSGTPTADPGWLERARAACFGNGASGLPNSGGWIMLSLAPLSILFVLLAALGRDVLLGLSRIARSLQGRVLMISLMLLLGFQAAWATGRVQSGLARANADYGPIDRGTLPENYPRTTQDASSFLLIDQHGEEVSLESFKGKVLVLTFAFAHCQTVCPALVATTRTAISQLPAERSELSLITLDPWRDTPSSLPSLAKRWKLPENARVLSGEIEAVTQVAAQYGVATKRNEKNGNITHPGLVFIVGADSKIAYTFNNPSAEWIRQAVESLL